MNRQLCALISVVRVIAKITQKLPFDLGTMTYAANQAMARQRLYRRGPRASAGDPCLVYLQADHGADC